MTRTILVGTFLAFATLPAIADDETDGSGPPREIIAPKVISVDDASEPVAMLVQVQMPVVGGTIQSLALERADEGIVRIPIVIDDELDELVLAPHSFRSDDFQVLVPGRTGVLMPLHPVPEPTTYRGTLANRPHTQVAATIFENQLTAFIVLDDETWRYVQPIRKHVPMAGDDQHLVYSGSDVIPAPGVCGVRDDEIAEPRVQPPGAEFVAVPPDIIWGAAAESGRNEGEGSIAIPNGGQGFNDPTFAAYTATVAFDADFPYYQANNSSIAQTIAALETVMAGVNLAYERDTFIRHMIGTVIVRTSAANDPYTATNAEALLNQMTAHWNANHFVIPRSTAHLFTGRDLTGNFIGFAAVGVVCNTSQAYGVSQVTFSDLANDRVVLVAHELGHNWNARHCNQSPNICTPCNIMCSNIGGCGGFGAPDLRCSIPVINAFAAGLNCLTVSNNFRWVDFSHFGLQVGTFSFPFRLVSDAVQSVPAGGSVIIKSGSSNQTPVVSKAVTIFTWNGSVLIGQ